MLDHVLGADPLPLEVSGGELAGVRARDRGVGSLAQHPRERCDHAVEVVGVLPGECPGVRADVEVPALGLGALHFLGRQREDAGYLLW